ncbi:MAG: tRNA epoxyqueuosine(34) reductase QueG [Candidatus Eiseniibacteriota bacterium]
MARLADRATPAAPDSPALIKAAIAAKARALGFDDVGFAPASLPRSCGEHLASFLRDGGHGDMDWLADRAAERADPRTLWPEARTAIVLALNYGPHEDPMKLVAMPERGAVSVYARGRDYHDVVKKKLKELGGWLHRSYGAEVKVFVDTAPVMEKPLAQRAGLGWQGKHSNLVSRDYGSWLFLGEIFTALALPPDAPESDHCGECRRCLDVCPTAAFPGPYRLDARRCISYLTIEHKGTIAREFRALIGNRIYGCDDCLAACPWNKFASRTAEYAFMPRVELTAPKLADLVKLDDASFRRVFSGSPIKRIGRDRFIRNVLIALGNGGDARQRDAVEPLLADASPLVRAMAVWALGRLVDAASFAALRERVLPGEGDAEVRAEWLAEGAPAPSASAA